MALKAYEGFDHYNSTTADMVARFGWLQWTTGFSCSFVSPGANSTGKALQVSSDAFGDVRLTGSWAGNLATFYFGMRLQLTAAGNFTLAFNDNTGGASQFKVYFNTTSASVQVRNNSGTILVSSANNVFPINSYFYFEVGATVGASGSVTLKVNGATVATYSGNTQTGTANAWVNGHTHAPDGSAAVHLVDDLYICDSVAGAGTYAMNTFLTSIGDPRVWYGPPNANSSVTFTPLANANWQEVSETAMDSDTSYNSSSTVGQADLFTTTGFPTMSVVLAVGVIGAYRKDNSGARNASNELKSGATTANGTSQPLNASYTYYQDFWVEDPNTSASWTVANAQAVTFGYHLDS